MLIWRLHNSNITEGQTCAEQQKVGVLRSFLMFPHAHLEEDRKKISWFSRLPFFSFSSLFQFFHHKKRKRQTMAGFLSSYNIPGAVCTSNTVFILSMDFHVNSLSTDLTHCKSYMSYACLLKLRHFGLNNTFLNFKSNRI